MAHKFCHAFSLVRSLFAQPFPYRKYRVDNSLYCIKVAGGLCRLALHIVLQQIYIQSPMHTFYRPVMAHNGTKERSVCRQTAYIQTFFTCIYRGRLSDGLGHVFYNRHVSAPFLLVGNNFETIIYVVCSCLDSSMTEFGTISIRI